ncbi:DUF2634 domain-containing protein [Paenibacillus thermotolerans]|uniref:DUF2634 domain-containing protein n=1 Tax=Paenibacillus thermotolerans TaxID=3027807 RepID=UPI0023676D11|nr:MULTISPECIES: DUF2634 domain-containing protein [unclassified Paenibacillus]
MLPKIAELEIQAASPAVSQTTVHKTYAWDYESGDFLLIDGRMVELTGIEYVKAWVEKALRTVAGSGIYAGTAYGSEHHSLIGSTFKAAFAEAEYERMIREALLQNDAILRVENFSFSQSESGARLLVSFDVISIYGTTEGTAIA